MEASPHAPTPFPNLEGKNQVLAVNGTNVTISAKLLILWFLWLLSLLLEAHCSDDRP